MAPGPNDAFSGDPVQVPLALFLVEDNPADADAVSWTAGTAFPGVVLHHVETLEEAVSHPDRERVDCLLLDPGLPGFTGLEALEELRRRSHRGPVVILTGNLDREAAFEALGAGAQEFLTKDELNPREFRRAVRYAIERHRVVTQLTEANSRLENLQALLAHDLRQPMTVIAHALQLLRRTDLTAEQEKLLLDRCDDASGSMQQIVDDVLSVARPGPPDVSPCPLGAIVDDVAASMGLFIQEAGGTLHVDDDLPAVLAIPAALRHVLRNLLANSIVHRHPERPPVIRIEAVRSATHGGLTITDNGVGIPAADRHRVFDLGVRLDQSSARGLGLGLAAVRSLVREMNGRVWITEPHDGTSGTAVHVEFTAAPAA